MESSSKAVSKNQNTTQGATSTPWSMLFSPRPRNESDISGSPTSSGYQTGTHFGALQRQQSKSNEEYLWMILRQFIDGERGAQAQPPRHSTNTRRSARNMVAQRCLPFVFLLAAVIANPAPGRIPKVYNALITSNQNLEPSKAFPLYQPVLHNTFPFPYQPFLYGDYPITNGIIPVPTLPPNDPNLKTEEQSPASSEAPEEAEPSEKPTAEPESSSPPPEDGASTPVPPPPKTESPIPLNEFGLPPQVLPIDRINPSYEYTPLTFPYPYSGLRFYDPYDPFGFNAFPSYPLYRPLTNVLGQPLPIPAVKSEAPAVPSTSIGSTESPPAEPSELNVLNYSSKDPAIPNVPPPPLPKGGLKVDDE